MSQETIQSQRGRQDKGLPPATLLGDQDFYLFNEGSHRRLYEKLGAHRMRVGGEEGTYFAVWAPNANRVAVIGSFNQWNRESHPLRARGNSGVWEGFIPGVERGALYKYLIHSRFLDYRVEKADPFSLFNEIPPKKASIVWDLDYSWGDGDWLRRARRKISRPQQTDVDLRNASGFMAPRTQRATARSPIVSWRRCWPIMSSRRDLLTSSFCR